MIESLSPSVLIENLAPAVVVIAYLAYEIHWGRLSKLVGRIDGVVDAVLALAREHDDIDEEAVADRVNGETPEDLLKRGEDHESD